MSYVVGFRDRVIGVIKEKITALRDVDWYDGLFDEEDVASWSLKTPCAFVSVRRAPGSPHSTGEINIDLRVTVVIIVSDKRKPRDADGTAWQIAEDIALLANQSGFGDPNAGRACEIKYERLREPALRRDGVAVAITEWSSTLTIGTNKVVERESVRDPAGNIITQTPKNLFLGTTTIDRQESSRETVVLTPESDQ